MTNYFSQCMPCNEPINDMLHTANSKISLDKKKVYSARNTIHIKCTKARFKAYDLKMTLRNRHDFLTLARDESHSASAINTFFG